MAKAKGYTIGAKGSGGKTADGRPRTFQMVADKEFIQILDRWRNSLRPPLARAQAIRLAVYQAADKKPN